MRWDQINQILYSYWWALKMNLKQNFQMMQLKSSKMFMMLSNTSLNHFGPLDLNCIQIFRFNKIGKNLSIRTQFYLEIILYHLYIYYLVLKLILKSFPYNPNQYRVIQVLPPYRGHINTQAQFNTYKSISETQTMYLGGGGFSNVFLEKTDQKLYACKKIALPRDDSIRYLFDEVNAFRCLNHPNIVKCFGYRICLTEFQIGLEYIKGQTMDLKYKEYQDNGYDNTKIEQVLFYWIFQICLALIELEQKGIVHRDLKPRNILVNQSGLIKIVDFGISKILFDQRSSIAGTAGFIAPEIILKGKISTHSDVWSLGVTIYYLLHEKIPYEKAWKIKKDRIYLDQTVFKKEIEFQGTKWSKELISLIKAMLQNNPSKRIKPKEVLSHPALKSREREFSKAYNEAIKN